MQLNDAVAILAGSITTIVSVIGGILWLIASKLAPIEKAMLLYIEKLEVIIGNNTRAMDRIEAVVARHDSTLDDHSDRLTRIETVHHVNGCEERV